jgi:histidinol phosphatase-like enzyme
MEDIHRRMLSAVEEAGGVIEKVYACTHSKTADCDCRKPRPGMLLRASRELGLDMNDAIFIGDSITDMQAGSAAGVPTMLVLTGLGTEHYRLHYQQTDHPFPVALDLQHAVDIILQHSMQTSLERAGV